MAHFATPVQYAHTSHAEGIRIELLVILNEEAKERLEKRKSHITEKCTRSNYSTRINHLDTVIHKQENDQEGMPRA